MWLPWFSPIRAYCNTPLQFARIFHICFRMIRTNRKNRNDFYTPPHIVGATLAVARIFIGLGIRAEASSAPTIRPHFPHMFSNDSHESRRRVQRGHGLRGFRSFRNDSYTPPSYRLKRLRVPQSYAHTVPLWECMSIGRRQPSRLPWFPTIRPHFPHMFSNDSHESRRRAQSGHVLRIATISTHPPYQGKKFLLCFPALKG